MENDSGIPYTAEGTHGPTSVSPDDADVIRLKVNATLVPDEKSRLGQFMTPSVIAEFMASLFDDPINPAELLDAGAGIGSLTIAAARRLQTIKFVDAWELDPLMQTHLELNLRALAIEHSLYREDFITSAVQRIALGKGNRYTHAILNPPYKKLNSDSIHRALLRKVGIETVNLYSAFVALTLLLMRQNGQVVAIIPRSFCNGPYYRPFRYLLFKTCSIDRIHVFESRTQAFKDDDVLQENVIIKLCRGKQQGNVIVSCSHDHQLNDYREHSVSFSEIVKPTDSELFIHIPTEHEPTNDEDDFSQCSLFDIGLEVCTGPAVDFRLKLFWLNDLIAGAVPILYPHHFSGGGLQYPKSHRKPNALLDTPEVQHWLMPNECYALVKRFSSKEERRRVVAYVYDPDQIACQQVAFENHWNVFHSAKRGIDRAVAKGLACFLNSTAFDRRFRVFSGHTQVNATDLRNMKYPNVRFLKALGRNCALNMAQTDIDGLIQTTQNEQRH